MPPFCYTEFKPMTFTTKKRTPTARYNICAAQLCNSAGNQNSSLSLHWILWPTQRVKGGGQTYNDISSSTQTPVRNKSGNSAVVSPDTLACFVLADSVAWEVSCVQATII